MHIPEIALLKLDGPIAHELLFISCKYLGDKFWGVANQHCINSNCGRSSQSSSKLLPVGSLTKNKWAQVSSLSQQFADNSCKFSKDKDDLLNYLQLWLAEELQVQVEAQVEEEKGLGLASGVAQSKSLSQLSLSESDSDPKLANWNDSDLDGCDTLDSKDLPVPVVQSPSVIGTLDNPTILPGYKHWVLKLANHNLDSSGLKFFCILQTINKHHPLYSLLEENCYFFAGAAIEAAKAVFVGASDELHGLKPGATGEPINAKIHNPNDPGFLKKCKPVCLSLSYFTWVYYYVEHPKSGEHSEMKQSKAVGLVMVVV